MFRSGLSCTQRVLHVTTRFQRSSVWKSIRCFSQQASGADASQASSSSFHSLLVRFVQLGGLGATAYLFNSLVSEPTPDIPEVSYIPQGPMLRLDDIYDPEKKKDFLGRPPRIMAWLQDGEHYVELDSSKRLWRVHASTGSRSELYDKPVIKSAFTNAGLTDEEATNLVEKGAYEFSPDEKAIFINHRSGLYYYHFPTSRAARLSVTNNNKPERVPSFSPDGRMVAFVRDYDLYVVNVDRQNPEPVKVTEGGHENLMNGVLDWVYQEEIYGRGNYKGYWWSPDSESLAYLQLDESPVPPYTVVDHLPQHLDLELTRYPKAGDPNPTARLAVISNIHHPPSTNTHWIDLDSRYKPEDLLVVRVGWTPDSQSVVFQAQNKEQTYLHLNYANPTTGQVRTILQEVSPAWVNVLGEPTWTEDGNSFIWISERTGYAHLYLYDREGGLKKTITEGQWEVTDFHGLDEKTGWLYLTSTMTSPRDLSIARVKLDGSQLEEISNKAGAHHARFNPQFSQYIDMWSDVQTPTQTRLHNASGEIIRLVDENKVQGSEYWQEFSDPEFVQVKTRDGKFQMEAMLIKPPGFDPSKKYPVMSYTYSGPHHPQVMNRYSALYTWHQLLAQSGYVVWVCDNRTASSKGAKSTWPCHGNFGELELKDLEDGINWLKKHDWVDADRLGLFGWSYGGYMTAYAMTHDGPFQVGISGAPVTDWKLYDTIYTERYMKTPQNNPEGYKKSSILEAAANLKGKYLLIHGTMDDNVHFQQSVQFIEQLERANKDFQFLLYPGSRHGVTQPHRKRHMWSNIYKFIQENL